MLSRGPGRPRHHALQAVVGDGAREGAAIGKPTGRQDRHLPGEPGRVVRRLRAQAHRGGVDGLSERRRSGWDDPETPSSTTPWPMNSKGRLVHGRPVTGGSFPATIWKKFMEAGHRRPEDAFVEPTPEQIAGGQVINEVLLMPDETGQNPTSPARHHHHRPAPGTPRPGTAGPTTTHRPTTTTTEPGRTFRPSSVPTTGPGRLGPGG